MLNILSILPAGLTACLSHSVRRGLLHTTPSLRRSYKEWTEALRNTRFTPVEVLAVAHGVQYVTIDPTNEDLLLPLSSKRYTAMQQDLMREQSSLTVLLGPGDIRKPGSLLVSADGFIKPADPSKTSPTPPGDGIMPYPVRSSFRYLRSLVMDALRNGNMPVHRRTKIFATHLLKRTKVVAGRVVMTRDNLGPLVSAWGLYLHQLLGHPLRRSFRGDLYATRRFLVGILARGGPLFLAKYLKVSLFMIHKYLAGEPLKNTIESGIFIGCTNAGLPKWLPVKWRLAIRSRNYPMIRLISSFLTFYKVIHTPNNVVSLTAVMATQPEVSWYDDFRCYVSWFLRAKTPFVPSDYTLESPNLTTKAGPNISPGGLGIFVDAKAWVDLGDDNALFQFFRIWGLGSLIPMVYDCAKAADSFKRTLSTVAVRFNPSTAKLISGSAVSKQHGGFRVSYDNLALGKLCFLEESAGKVRTIAIGDVFTQWVMEPIHRVLFKVLKTWEDVDGTFNQQRAVDTFSSRGYKEIFSFDLSKATDTIPNRLYLPIVGTIWGEAQAKAWLSLLVDRDFVVSARKGLRVEPEVAKVRYTRGQPMGFLSSWAALAVLHHLVIQYAAYRVLLRLGNRPENWRPGPLPFMDYLILGDDMVVACPEVAEEYKNVCANFGISLSLYKSFVSSKGFMNFASQSVIDGHNVSPASAVEHFGIKTLVGRVAFLQTLHSKNFFGIIQGGQLKFGTLVRGLFNPTLYKVGIKPALRAGEMPHFLRLGISALANTRLFPNLALASVYRLPWLPVITGDEDHVRSILNKKVKALSENEVVSLAEAVYGYIRRTLEPKDCSEGIITYLQGRAALPISYPFLKLFLRDQFLEDIKAGPFGELQRLRRSFLLCKLVYTRETGSVYERIPHFELNVLVDSIIHDIETLMEIDRLPGFKTRVPELLKKHFEIQELLPWASILVNCLATNQQEPLAVSALLKRLTKEYRKIARGNSSVETASLWLTVEPLIREDEPINGSPASVPVQAGPVKV
jgi:hypothetical protein